MKPTLKAAAYALAKSPYHSVREMLALTPSTKANYLLCFAHPDDEILAAGLARRLAIQGNLTMMVVTDGSGNTDENRLRELPRAYARLGYQGGPLCLMHENDIYTKAASQKKGIAPSQNLDSLARHVQSTISKLERIMINNGIDRVVTNAFEGGHFVHDLTNLMVLYAALRQGVEVYEVPQYSISPLLDTETDLLHLAINTPKLSVAEYADAFLGIPLSSENGLNEPSVGVINGILDVTLSEFVLKYVMKKIHTSQKSSLKRGDSNITRAEFSQESYTEVPQDRDFSQLPGTALPFYEFCDWRPVHLTFQTFIELVKKIEK